MEEGMRRRVRFWSVVVLAAPALLAILGLAYQMTIYSDRLAELPRALGGTVLVVTGIMGAAAAVWGAWLVLRSEVSRAERSILAVASIAGGLYAATILALQIGLRDGLFS